MRLALAVFFLAACGAKAATGPAWPKMAEREADGGESLAPRAKASAVAAASDDDDDEPAPAPVAAKPAATAKAEPEPPKPATTTAPTQAPDDVVITTEELVIEIDD